MKYTLAIILTTCLAQQPQGNSLGTIHKMLLGKWVNTDASTDTIYFTKDTVWRYNAKTRYVWFTECKIKLETPPNNISGKYWFGFKFGKVEYLGNISIDSTHLVFHDGINGEETESYKKVQKVNSK